MAGKISIISNTDWFRKFENVYDVENIDNLSLSKVIKKAKNYSDKDIVILNISSRLLIYFCIAKILLPGKNFKLISVDLILSKPISFFEKAKAIILKYLFRKVDYFILYMKEWTGYKLYYGIEDRQLKYIPFKVNSYNVIKNINKCDNSKCNNGYIFSGGMSKRDYDTLFKAIDDLDVKIIILLPSLETIKKHGTTIRSQIPSNATIVNHDCNAQSWIEYMANAKFVVIPISKDTISSTGISTYLVAMALNKCVIISRGPSTIDVIPKDCAVMVAPANSDELKEAILKIDQDDEYRNYIANNGYKYAMSLKGHDRLVGDIIDFIGSNHLTSDSVHK